MPFSPTTRPNFEELDKGNLYLAKQKKALCLSVKWEDKSVAETLSGQSKGKFFQENNLDIS